MCLSLTMLGIIIGMTTVTILASLVNGCMGSVMESLASMGMNQININVTSLASRSLDVDQMYAFYEEHTDLFGELGPNVTLSSTIKYGDDSMTSTSVARRSEQYLEIKSYELETGRNIVYSDIVSRRKVYVIDACVANELHGSTQDAIEQTPRIDGYAFKITGVAKAQDEDNMKDGGTDDFVWIPYSVAVKMSRNTNVSSYTFTTLNAGKADKYATVIRNFPYEAFRDEDLYRVTATNEMLDFLNEQTAMMSGMLGGIAEISLLMVGVDAMNIMLVSVTERTREIGIRKSLRAGKGIVMRQSVIEAAMTSSMGSVIGTLVGCVATTVVGAVVGVSATSALSAVIISSSASTGTGLLFGYMPAGWTTNLDPIDALRSERYVPAGHHAGKALYLNRQLPDLTLVAVLLHYIENVTENN